MSTNNFIKNFFTYKKMSKDSLATYYKNNKERLQRKLMKDIKVFVKKKKKKSDNIVVNYTKIYQEIKNKSLLNIEKILSEKTCYSSYRKLLSHLNKSIFGSIYKNRINKL